jgi:hypothetical protein
MQRRKEQSLASAFLKVLIFALPSISPISSTLTSSPLLSKTHLITTPPLNPQPSTSTINYQQLSYQTLTYLSTPHPSSIASTPNNTPSYRLTQHPSTSVTRDFSKHYLGTHITESFPYLPLLLTCSLLPSLSSNSHIPSPNPEHRNIFHRNTGGG